MTEPIKTLHAFTSPGLPVTFDLQGIPSAGYNWTDLYKTYGLLVHCKYSEVPAVVTDNDQEVLVGGPVTYYFSLEAAAPGDYLYLLGYKRSWENTFKEGLLVCLRVR